MILQVPKPCDSPGVLLCNVRMLACIFKPKQSKASVLTSSKELNADRVFRDMDSFDFTTNHIKQLY